MSLTKGANKMRNALAIVIVIVILVAGLYQCAVTPYTLMYDKVSGRMERVYSPNNRPVLVILQDALFSPSDLLTAEAKGL
jgi:hypothetical protein